VTRPDGPHHNQVAFGDEPCVGAFAAPVKARVQLTFAQAKRVERGVVDARRPTNVQ
jgi:hypothetical protein